MPKLPAIEELPFTLENGAVAIFVAAGVLYCFLGYRTLKMVIALTGFFLAGGVAAVIAAWLSKGEIIVAGIAGLIGGVFGSIALIFLFKCGVFLVGGLGALVAAMHLTAGMEQTWIPWVVLGAGVVGGGLALLLRKTIIVLATAATGSWMLVSGILFFLAGPGAIDTPNKQIIEIKEGWVSFACWAVIAVTGALAQFSARTRSEQKTRNEPD